VHEVRPDVGAAFPPAAKPDQIEKPMPIPNLIARRAILWQILLLLVIALCLFVLLRPQVIWNSEIVTIIDTRLGELDIHVWPDGPITIWYQNIDRGINMRLLVLRR
jgi:hypothetical protein